MIRTAQLPTLPPPQLRSERRTFAAASISSGVWRVTVVVLSKGSLWSVVVVGTMTDLRSGLPTKAYIPISLTDAGMVTCWREHCLKA